jgi:PAS domain S-box-containing protein
MRAFLDGLPDPFVILSTEGLVDDWNEAAAESLGWAAREARGRALADLLGCEALTEMVSIAIRPDDHRWGRLGGISLTRRGGAGFAAEAEWFLFDVGDGDRVGVFLREATRPQTQGALTAKLEQVTEQFVGAFEASAIGMTLTATDGRFIAVNPAFCRLLRRDADDLITCSFQELTHPDDLEKDLVQFRRVFAGEIDSYQMPKRYLLPDGGIIWALLTVSVVRGEDGQPLHFVSQVQDIADRMTAEGELQRYAQHLEALSGDDPLTGLGSAGGLMAALSEELTLMRAGGEPCTLVTVGVAGGDAATLAAAESMREVARGEDLAARLGDSELGLLLPGVDAAMAEPILARIREALGARAATFGAATAADGDDPASLLARARERSATAANGDIGAPAQVRALLELLRRQLEMPVSFLTRADGSRELLEHAVGDLGRFGLAEGEELRAADFACCPGVPVRLRSGELYGTLGAIDSQPCRKLDVRQADLLEFVSELAGRAIDAEADVERRRVAETSAIGVRALLVALEARDKYTGEHSREVVGLACRVARRLGLGEREVRDVEQVALLHDVGKVGIPDAILQKQGPLDEVEWDVMRKHPIVGERIIAGIPGLAHLAPAMRGEHERWDGRGYPDGLAGEAIPIASRITFACDAFHAMTSERPYRPPMAAADACEELRRNAGTQFDPTVVEALLAELKGEGAGEEEPALSEPARRPGS